MLLCNMFSWYQNVLDLMRNRNKRQYVMSFKAVICLRLFKLDELKSKGGSWPHREFDLSLNAAEENHLYSVFIFDPDFDC